MVAHAENEVAEFPTKLILDLINKRARILMVFGPAFLFIAAACGLEWSHGELTYCRSVEV